LEINLGNLNQAALYASPIFLCLLKYLLSKKLLKYLLSNTSKVMVLFLRYENQKKRLL